MKKHIAEKGHKGYRLPPFAFIPSVYLKLGLLFVFLFRPGFHCFSQISDAVFKKVHQQLDERGRSLLNHAHEKFNSKFYHEAITYIDSIQREDLPYLVYIKGVIYSHDDATRHKAVLFLSDVSGDSTNLIDFNFNRAFAYSRIDSFALAINEYQKALDQENHKKHKNSRHADEIELRIEQCRNILAMRATKNHAVVKSIGPPINSEYSEYCPIITSNEDVMVFTYRGPRSVGGKQEVADGLLHQKKMELFYEDIFVSNKINDTLWGVPERQENLDTKLHDAAVSINNDGSEMFVYRNLGKGKGDLYLSRRKGNSWSKPVVQMHLNSPEWDGSACFLPNQNRIIISSERKGGYGGKDLYYAEKIKENVWGNITNLGPTINSKYDEDAPFVTADGNILFFSTNNQSSIGGYDIERSDLVNGFWSKPYNLGPPINTPNDDEYFTVRADGQVAYYSSSQKNGDGAQDIFVVKPGIPGKPASLLQIEGLVTLDGKPIAGEVELRSLGRGAGRSYIVNANEASGRFLCNLPSKDEYELTVHIDKCPPQVIFLNTAPVDSFAVMNIYVEFYSPGVGIKEEEITKPDTAGTLPVAMDTSLLQKYAAVATENIKYKVQIGAYRFPKNFNYNNFIGLPKIMLHKDDKGLSRFVLGECATFEEVSKLLERVKAFVPDAFVVVYEKDKRISLRNHLQSLSKKTG